MADMISITLLICALGSTSGSPVEPGAATIVPNAPVSVEQQPAPVEGAHADEALDVNAGEESAPPNAEATEDVEASARERLPLGPAVVSGAPAERATEGAETKSASTGLGVWQTIGCTGAVIGLILAGRWVLVRSVRSPIGSSSVRSQLGMGGRAPSGVLFVLGRYPVSRGQSLVLIQLDRRVLLLSQSGTGFQTLAELRDPEEVASIIAKARDEEGESLSAKFSSLMRTFDRKHVETERAESLRAVVRSVRVDGVGEEARGVEPGEESADAVRERLTALRALVS